MDEEGAVKAPVTRLRRSRSVELSEDTKSPGAPSTPTKKRGGRLAAKPQLELIDENIPQNSPKRAIRKSIARDIAEPAEEKPATPARRNARIISNTSLVLETSQACDSPRAMRAARRNSQLGSDNEVPDTPVRIRRTRKYSGADNMTIPASDTPVTPARIRRTKKDSSTSNDKDVTETANKALVDIVIFEEPESDVQLSKTVNKIPHDTDAKKTTGSETAIKPLVDTAISEEPESDVQLSKIINEIPHDTDAKKTTSSETAIKPLIDIAISEEPESDVQLPKTISDTPNDTDTKKTPGSRRKSPRLQGKKGAKHISENNNNLSQENNPVLINGKGESTSLNSSLSPENKTADEGAINGSDPQKHDLLICTVNLVDLESQSKTVSSAINKTSGVLDNGQNVNSKRHRTKSWTTLTSPQTSLGNLFEVNYLSDQENLKKKSNRKKNTNYKVSNKDGAGDNFRENNDKSESLHGMEKNGEILLSLTKNKRSKGSSLSSDNINVSANTNDSGSVSEIHKPLNSSNESNKENLLEMSTKNNGCNASELPFNKNPSSDIQLTVLIEDPDLDSVGKSRNGKVLLVDDQCVPVVEHDLQQAKTIQNDDLSIANLEINTRNFAEINNRSVNMSANNDSCEPMDIDETIPENLLLNSSTEKDEVDNVETQGIAETNKSKRQSLISNYNSQNLETTRNENKSTLVVSKTKDKSSSDHESKCVQENNESFIPISGKEVVNNDLSLSCLLTSTPVQQKDFKKMALQLNTSGFTPNSDGKNKETGMSLLKAKSRPSSERSEVSKNSSSSEEEEKRDGKKMSWVDDEAEDAGDNYESGDSQNEEERLYEKENEILDKGETLPSDDDVSDVSDYEKDSFVVCSDEEDYDLLSGSGDDLDFSDNELSMSAKSKKKYNELHVKQQKKASREMFEARHKLNTSDKRTKSKKTVSRLDSTHESDNEIMVPPKKNKRMRLDSSLTDESESKYNTNVIEANYADNIISVEKEKRFTISISELGEKETAAAGNRDFTINESVMSEIGHTKKKKSKRLSDSVCNNTLNEESTAIPEKSDAVDNEIGHKSKKKSNRLSESVCDNVEDVENTAISEKSNSIVNKSCHNNKKKSKRLSESICDNALSHESACITDKIHTIVNEIGHKKKKKYQSLSETVGEDVSNQIEMAAFKKKDPMINESHTKHTSELMCGNVLHEYDISVTYDSRLRKKKNKLLLESLCNESAMNENEITVYDDETMVETDDPLSIQVKTEVKTPQKALNISTINFTDRDEVEHMNIDENVSMMIPNESSDPLQTTMTQNNVDHGDDEFSISENEEIIENYDFVLKKLNEDRKVKQIKTTDMSLNLDKKAKKISQPIIDQLNITQTKTSKKKNKSKTPESEKHEKLNAKYIKNVVSDFDEATSDSIDLKLLLSEDSNDSEKHNVMCDPEPENPGQFIPLKRTKGKINIREHVDGNEIVLNESLLNTSSNKKKHRKSSQNEQTATAVEEDMFFVDKTGSLSNSFANSPLNTSSMSNKKLSFKDSVEAVAHQNIVVENEPVAVVAGSKKRKRKSSGNIDFKQATTAEDQAEVVDMISKKKKRKISNNGKDYTIPMETQGAVSNNLEDNTKVPQKTKKENKSKKSKKRVEQLQQAKMQMFKPEPEKKTGGRKRKQRDDDDGDKTSKVLKQNSFDKINVIRLPDALINRLEEKPSKEVIKMKKSRIISTTRFLVEEARKRKSQPSNYLEQSVYLNDTQSPVEKKIVKFAKPKVLPFIPTASTSDSGFTTNFRVNVVPKTMEFVAQSTHTNNFKNDYINNKKIKKFTTYDLYKQHRNMKLSKF